MESKYNDLEINSIHQAKISPAQKNLQLAIAENNQLQAKAWLDEKYEHARHEFSTNEAEVYKQGDKLLLRLKGLSFATSQFVISPENYSLLNKVQNVIKDFASAKVVIEGHTDDTGSKTTNKTLSAKRASAVESYFVANDIVPASNIKSQGFGDDKPISTNKTKLGRAENRRVDVIITPVEIPQETAQ